MKPTVCLKKSDIQISSSTAFRAYDIGFIPKLRNGQRGERVIDFVEDRYVYFEEGGNYQCNSSVTAACQTSFNTLECY